MSTASPFVAPVVEFASDIEDDVDYALDLSNREFEKFILASIDADAAARSWKVLLHDDVVIRTKVTLSRILHEANEKLIALKPKSDSPEDAAEYAAQRQELITFRVVANLRQRTVKQASNSRAVRLSAQHDRGGFAKQMRVIVRDLAMGVNEHRLACIESGIEPEEHDLALWGLLDELSPPPLFFDAPTYTLAEMVANGKWAARSKPRGQEA